MSRCLPAWLVGSLAFVALVVNTVVCAPLLMVIACLRVLVPLPLVVEAARRAAENIATTWIDVNVLGLKVAGHIEWEVEERATLSPNASYVVVSNHRSAVDIVVVQWLFKHRIPLVKFFLKRELIWVPVLGVAWWALEFPFMRRYPRAVLQQRPDLRDRDLNTTRRACERFRGVPTTLLNFVEGTRFTTAKRDRQAAPYRHLLAPRAGGVAQVVSTLGQSLQGVLDVTIVYPDKIPTFWDLISGQITRIAVHIEEVPIDPTWIGRDYGTDEAFRLEFQQFLRDVWTAKDARIERLLP